MKLSSGSDCLKIKPIGSHLKMMKKHEECCIKNSNTHHTHTEDV